MERHVYKPNQLQCAGSATVGYHNYCSACSYCLVQGCQCFSPSSYHFDDLPTTTGPTTQKAKGIFALCELALPNFDTLSFQLVQNQSQVKTLQLGSFKLFARPCPSIPRHGFLESCVVTTKEEISALLEETLKLDPTGELILMRYIDAAYNMVWTPGLLTVGAGNDGATSGKDAVTLPTSPTLPFINIPANRLDAIFKKAGITDAPYLEFVDAKSKHDYEPSRHYITQLRDGPSLPPSKDFIPNQVTIKSIILASDYPDLLQWEARIHAAAREAGTVVYHRGGALSSHYGVHCKINNVPYITSFAPNIGQVITPTNTTAKEIDAALVIEGFKEGLNVSLHSGNFALYAVFTLACLHNLAYFTKDESRYVGIAIAVLLRLGIAACKGEARHRKNVKLPIDIRNMDRNAIYHKMLNDFSVGIKRLGYTEYVFRFGYWESNIGGYKWADCTKANIELFNLVLALYKVLDTDEEKNGLKRLLEAYNKNINQAHNNGWYLDKYVEKIWFDWASKSGSLPAIYCGALFHYLRAPGKEKADLSKFKPIRIITNKIKRPRKLDNGSNKVDNANTAGGDSDVPL